jgi:hypothetical protein
MEHQTGKSESAKDDVSKSDDVEEQPQTQVSAIYSNPLLNHLNDVNRARENNLSTGMRQQRVMRLQSTSGNRSVLHFLSRNQDAVVQRDVTPSGGNQSQAVPVQRPGGPEGQNIAPGGAGYSRAMLAEIPQMADSLSSSVEGMLLTNVAINTTGLGAQIRLRSDEKEPVAENQRDFMNTPSTTAHYRRAVEWIDSHEATMTQDKALVEGKAAAYNAWVPRANGVFTSVTRLGAMQAMLGATDNASMAAALSQGLNDAQRVAQRMAGAYNTQNQSEQLNVPAPDLSVESSVGAVAIASQFFNNKWIGWKIKVDLAAQAKTTDAEGTADRTRLEQINQTKQIIHNIGGMVDTTMSVVSGAPAAIQNVSSTVRQGEAALNAARNRRQIVSGQRPTHNPTYLTTDAQGNMIVRNVQTNVDRDAVSGATSATPASDPVALPVTVTAILDNIATFVYLKEVRQINVHLESIKTRLAAIQGAQAFLGMVEATDGFQTALNDYARLCNEMQDRLAARRDAYLKFGEQLDKFARMNRETMQNGQAPDEGQEKFAQIMTVVGQLREVITLGRGAVGGFDNPSALRDFVGTIASNRAAVPPPVNYRISLRQMAITPGEMEGFQSIYNQVGGFNSRYQAITTLFGPLDAQANAIMASLSPGGGSGRY